MLYTRFYTPVNLTSVAMVHEQEEGGMWVTVYYVTAEQSAPHPRDGSGEVGRRILDGRQFSWAELIADNGWSEVVDTVQAHYLAQPEPKEERETYDPKKHERDLRWIMG